MGRKLRKIGLQDPSLSMRPSPSKQDTMRNDPDIEAEIRAKGVLLTRQRLAILNVLRAASDHPTVDEILSRAKEDDASISQATVYRTLSALEKVGAVLKNEFDGTGARFELADRAHHDHLIDLDTGEVVEFHSEKIEKLQAQIAEELGYEIEWHRLELYARKRNRV